jgi:hypothetical protein
MITRRHLLGTAGAGAALTVSGLSLPKFSQAEAAGVELTPGVPQGIGSYVTMGTLPGKKPLIQLSDRPPNYEAPIEYLRTPITPNNEFYVRYHLSDIPEVKAEGYKIAVGGDGANGQAEITLDDLKKCRRSKWSRSISARATGAACRSRTCRAWNGAMAPWVARAGKAPGSRTCSTKSA